jgi:hypothetical protein
VNTDNLAIPASANQKQLGLFGTGFGIDTMPVPSFTKHAYSKSSALNMFQVLSDRVKETIMKCASIVLSIVTTQRHQDGLKAGFLPVHPRGWHTHEGELILGVRCQECWQYEVGQNYYWQTLQQGQVRVWTRCGYPVKKLVICVLLWSGRRGGDRGLCGGRK